MLNKDYKLGSRWKLTLIFPLVFIAFLIVSCTEKDATMLANDSSLKKSASTENIIYSSEVEEMATFQGGEPIDFRKFIAQNLVYPDEAKENGASGKVFGERNSSSVIQVSIDIRYKPRKETMPKAGPREVKNKNNKCTEGGFDKYAQYK